MPRRRSSSRSGGDRPHLGECRGDRVDVVGVAVAGGVAADLAQGRDVGGDHGRAGVHRLHRREAEALEQRREDERGGVAVQLVEVVGRSARRAGDEQLEVAAVAAVGLAQAGEVLARLVVADVQEVARLASIRPWRLAGTEGRESRLETPPLADVVGGRLRRRHQRRGPARGERVGAAGVGREALVEVIGQALEAEVVDGDHLRRARRRPGRQRVVQHVVAARLPREPRLPARLRRPG